MWNVNGIRYIVENNTNNALFLRIAKTSRNGTEVSLLHISCGGGEDSFPVSFYHRLQVRTHV